MEKKNYSISYLIGDQKQWYMLDAESQEEAEKKFLKNAKIYYGGNKLLTDFGFSVFPVISEIKEF